MRSGRSLLHLLTAGSPLGAAIFFLSLARPSASTCGSSHRSAGSPAAGLSGNSNPFSATDATLHWVCTEPGTDPRSDGRSDPTSSNLHCTHEHRLLSTILFPAVAAVLSTGRRVCRAGARSSVSHTSAHTSSGTPSARSPSVEQRLLPPFCLVSAD